MPRKCPEEAQDLHCDILDCGVPQGSILDPLLYLAYDNEMSNALKMCKAIIFADDNHICIL